MVVLFGVALGTETRAQLGASDPCFSDLDQLIMYRDGEDPAAYLQMTAMDRPDI